MKKFRVVVNGEEFEVEVEDLSAPGLSMPSEANMRRENPVYGSPKAYKSHGMNEVTAPLPGNITDIKVGVGDQVSIGDILMILEAMKMENEIVAPIDGKIKELYVEKGQIVPSGELLLIVG